MNREWTSRTHTTTEYRLTDSEQRTLSEELCGPHCDGKILHAPGVCDDCDQFPVFQFVRKLWGINYTEEGDLNKLPCPAEAYRGTGHKQWTGNRPFRKADEKGPF